MSKSSVRVSFCEHLLFVLLPISVSLTSCVPYQFSDAPAVTGKVVNRVNNHPIADASVSMTADKTSAQTRTSQTGNFVLPSLRHWGFYPLISEGWAGHIGTLRVEAVGYHSITVERLGLPGLVPSAQRLGVIKYERGDESVEQVRVALAPST